MKEVWKDYNEDYMISNYGMVIFGNITGKLILNLLNSISIKASSFPSACCIIMGTVKLKLFSNII